MLMMRTSKDGQDLIKSFESCRLRAYWDEAGMRWSIGWGRARGVREGDECTQQQADDWFAEDLGDIETVLGNLGLVLTQSQFDALVSFCYNVGFGKRGGKNGFLELGNGRPSTMLRRLRARDHAGAAAEFPKWIHTPGAENGLLARRLAEQALFLKEG